MSKKKAKARTKAKPMEKEQPKEKEQTMEKPKEKSQELFIVYLTADDIKKIDYMIDEMLEAMKDDEGMVISGISREAIEEQQRSLEGIKEELTAAKAEGRTL